MKHVKGQFLARFDCNEVGSMDEYVGYLIEQNWKDRWMKITQPVLLQSLQDEFLNAPELGEFRSGNVPWIPAEPGVMHMKCEEKDGVGQFLQTKFRAGVGKLLHMMQWSRVETQNAVRDLSRIMKVANVAYIKGLMRVMKYYVCNAKAWTSITTTWSVGWRC
jgi:hypothetical protein